MAYSHASETSVSNPAAGVLPRKTRIETSFDVPFVADLALREKQIQQNYRPIIAVHKWFARRPGTLFRSLILSEFAPGPLRRTYYQSHALTGLRIADPFMGGGTPLLEANRLGCGIVGFDINPMAYWVVRQEIEALDLAGYRKAAARVEARVRQQVGHLYNTTCLHCGADSPAKYFIWVKTHRCRRCDREMDLFPGYLLAENQRHPRHVLICSKCGELNETVDRKQPGDCRACRMPLVSAGPASRSRCRCPHCATLNSYPDPSRGAPVHRMIAIEYHCERCKPRHKGRFFKKPDDRDLARFADASRAWIETDCTFVPDDEIPPGDETDRLHKWGYRHYREMFNHRQLLGLELLCRAIMSEPDTRLRDALATNLSDLLRYQNMLCRYDTQSLKSLDIFSVHGFPVGLVQCESNLFGILSKDTGSSVGSGGWSNIVEKFVRAKMYCQEPFEIRHQGGRKVVVPMRGEWIGDQPVKGSESVSREVSLTCGNAAEVDLPPASLDAVLTDPPYFANVQYAELMDFCFVWLRRLVGDSHGCFSRSTTRSAKELTGNVTMERGLLHFSRGLSDTFVRMSRSLKRGAPLVFTFHHNTIDAYYPVAVAALDAGLVCSASIPCPAEMSASIHINGTGSSVVDTVFVCRSTGLVDRRTIASTPQEIAELVRDDLGQLSRGGVRVTPGDTRCVAYGHLVRMAIWNLRSDWDKTAPVDVKLGRVAEAVEAMGGADALESCLSLSLPRHEIPLAMMIGEEEGRYQAQVDEIPF